MDRKLIRPSLGDRRPSTGGAHRRGVVAESTHAEAGYLQQAVESGAPVVVELFGGETLRGRLEGWDRDVLLLAREGSAPLVVRRERIRCYAMERRSEA